MAGRVAGKVAFITGAGRGQGRSHATRLAEEGADIIAVDICRDYGTVPYAMATEADLAQTVKAVKALDPRIIATPADVRDVATLKAAVDDGWPSWGGWTSCRPMPGSARCSPGMRRAQPFDRGASGHQQRGAVPGLRRGPLRHRPGIHRRRGQHDQVNQVTHPHEAIDLARELARLGHGRLRRMNT
jgi:short chain dehydrogenase